MVVACSVVVQSHPLSSWTCHSNRCLCCRVGTCWAVASTSPTCPQCSSADEQHRPCNALSLRRDLLSQPVRPALPACLGPARFGRQQLAVLPRGGFSCPASLLCSMQAGPISGTALAGALLCRVDQQALVVKPQHCPCRHPAHETGPSSHHRSRHMPLLEPALLHSGN